MSQRFSVKALTLCLLFSAAACTTDDLTGPSTDPPTVVDTFTNTLTTNGASTEPFSVAVSGDVQATITKIEPNAAAVIGISLGTWNGTSCATVISNDKATQGTAIGARASGTGRLCVRVYDAEGTVTEPLTWEVTVVHP